MASALHDPEKAPSHARRFEDVLTFLRVDPGRGLSADEVLRRASIHGPNLLRRTVTRSLWAILWAQFESLIVWLLLVAAALSFLFREWVDGSAILVVVVINTVIGFVTEAKAVSSMEALRRMAQVVTRVRRDGQAQMVPARDLVPGDIVLLEGGDVITADMRLIEAANLQCDESNLTGESVPVVKSVEPIAPDAPLAERTSMLFKGAALTNGTGAAVVVATGMATELGRISALVEAAEDEATPLEKRLDRLSGQMVWAALGLTALITVTGIIGGQDMLLMVETGIALAVAAVPEGLPIVTTMALARGMWRMSRRNVLIERLAAVETLGATTVIFADKTGTLTENRMTVMRLSLPEGEVLLGRDEAPFMRGGAAVDPAGAPLLKAALEVCALCNNAELSGETAPAETRQGRSFTGVGDPMELALLGAAASGGIHRPELLLRWPEIREEAFEPATKMMATYHRWDDGVLVAVKGAPEAVIAHAATELARDEAGELAERPLDEAGRATWLARNEEMAGKGLRVLGLARKYAEGHDVEPYRDLILVGLVGLLDPPRGDVRDAIRACHEASMRVVMVTGDHALTAKSIADKIGLLPPGSEAGELTLIEGRNLKAPAELSPEEREKLVQAPIFARVSPEQKLNLIDLFQDRGEIVAMTGDGVNDAPALRKADIGVAMGLRGTQVAREAADMILRDDAFRSIVAAIRQGRVIFGNIRKFVIYLLSCNLSEILVVGLATLGGMGLPLLPLQILFLNLVTDVFPAFALGAGEGEGDIMRRPPRDPREAFLARRHWLSIIGHGSLITAATLAAFALAEHVLELMPDEQVTVSFLTLAFAQLWHVFNMRDAGSALLGNEITRNRLVWGALGLCVVIILAGMQLPWLAEILKLHPLPAEGWGVVIGASLAPLAIGQLILSLRRR